MPPGIRFEAERAWEGITRLPLTPVNRNSQRGNASRRIPRTRFPPRRHRADFVSL